MKKVLLAIVLIFTSLAVHAGGCAVSVSLSCSPSAGGTITSNNCSYTAVPNPGYTFSHWTGRLCITSNDNNNIPETYTNNPVSVSAQWKATIAVLERGHVEFVAYFTKVTTYTITWKNWDGTTLKTTTVNANATPSYTGSTPTKASDAQYTYTFSGWTPSIVAATANKTYTATYKKTARQYTIAVNSANTAMGTADGTGAYDYGTSHQLTAIPNDCYEFVRWSDGNPDNPRTVTVTGNVTYTAEFEKLSYTVKGKDSTGGHVEVEK